MKKLFTLLACLMVTFVASAQKEKLLVDYFSCSNRAQAGYASQVRNQVITGIQATSRLIVIDADTEQSLRIEEERRQSEGALADQEIRMTEMKKLGATYLLSGNLDNITTTRSETKDSEGKVTVHYDAKVSFTIKATNVLDGSLKCSESFVVGTGLFGMDASEATAVANAVNAIDSKMRKFVDVNFPLEATIIEMKEAKKNKMTSCYIDLGTDHGVNPGQVLSVFRIKMIAGRESKLEIGTLKIEEVVAGDVSDCKVTKGGDAIYTAFQNGDQLTVKSVARANPINLGL